MTLEELFQALKTLGMPVAYHHFDTAPTPPFITYQFTDDDDFKADNHNYAEISNIDIELYAVKKDPAKEKLIQDKLKSLGITYGKSETWIPSEKLRQVIFSIQLIGG